MIHQPTKRRDALLKWGVRFRSAITGRYVTRLYAFLHPHETVAEKVANKE